MTYGGRCFLTGILALFLIALVGCPASQSSKANVSSQPFRGEELTLVVPKPFNLSAIWEVLIQEWSAQSGATAKFVDYTPPDLPRANIETGDGVILFPLDQLGEIDGLLARLPANDEAFDSRDLFKGLRDRVVSREKQVIAVPISAPILVCYYRADLLRKANLKSPDTWEDYLELIDKLDSWAPGLVAVEPLSAEFRATTFFARALGSVKHPENYSVWFDIDTAKPVLNSPGFVQSLELSQRTWKKLAPQSLTSSPADCRQALLQGKAAIGLTFETRSVNVTAETERVDGIQLGVCRLPGSRTVFNRNSKKWDSFPAKAVNAPALSGFAGLAAGVLHRPNQANNKAAMNLLFSLTSTELFDQAFNSIPKSPCRKSQLGQAPAWFGPELSTEEASQYCDAVAVSLRDPQVVFELPIIGAESFRKATSDALDPLLRGEIEAEACLVAMQLAFEQIVEQLGVEAVRDSHRRGLGLPPAFKK